MSLDLLMNAAMDIPVNGGSILHWKFVLISIAYCFVSIFLRGIWHSFDENDKKHQPKKTVLRAECGECRINVESLLQDVESGGAGGGREQRGIGDVHNEEGEHQAQMTEVETWTVSDEDEEYVSNMPLINRLHVSEMAEGETGTVSKEDEEDVSNMPLINRLHVSEMAEGETGTVSKEDEDVSNLLIPNRLYAFEEGMRRRKWKRKWKRKNLDFDFEKLVDQYYDSFQYEEDQSEEEEVEVEEEES